MPLTHPDLLDVTGCKYCLCAPVSCFWWPLRSVWGPLWCGPPSCLVWGWSNHQCFYTRLQWDWIESQQVPLSCRPPCADTDGNGPVCHKGISTKQLWQEKAGDNCWLLSTQQPGLQSFWVRMWICYNLWPACFLVCCYFFRHPNRLWKT